MIAPLAVLLMGASTAVGATPWYEHPACKEAHEAVMTVELDRAEAAIEALDRSRSLDLRACGQWLRIRLSAVELAREGKSEALYDRREKRLKRLFSFALRHGRRHPELLDLAIEARMRRVQLLVERGEKSQALSEAKKVRKMIASRADAPMTHSRKYARGAIDLSIGQAPWPLRMLLGMAGVSGDEDEGRDALEALGDGGSVYRADALFLLHHFARANEKAGGEHTQAYGSELVALFPQNPWVVADRAQDLYESDQCDEALEVLAKTQVKLQSNPDLWTGRLRKKLYWLAGRCAYETGDRELARASLNRATNEPYGGYGSQIRALKRDLGG